MTRELTYKDAVNEAIRLEMRSDPSVIFIGEDVAGGPGRVGRPIRSY
jgi:acetoin:2,6-dichlorophenolindophenol oxidoreductase subunit beta